MDEPHCVPANVEGWFPACLILPSDGLNGNADFAVLTCDGSFQFVAIPSCSGQADLRVHGGPDQAAYVYPVEHYDYWKELLQRDDLDYGQFGENFTTAGLLENEVRIGDVFRFGKAIVQVTTPREPCGKLDMKMDDPHFKRKFKASDRSGFYLRVLQEGEVGAGDGIELIESDSQQMTVEEMFQGL